MRYMFIWKPDHLPQGMPSPDEIAAMHGLIEDMKKAGVLVATEGFAPSSAADAILRRVNGKLSVTDGPFAETKELIAGFCIVDVKSKVEAISWGERFLKIAGDGVSEMRLMYEQPPSS